MRVGAAAVAVLAAIIVVAPAQAARTPSVTIRVTLTGRAMRLSVLHVPVERRVVFVVHNASRIGQRFTVHGRPAHVIPAQATRTFALIFVRAGNYALSSREEGSTGVAEHRLRVIAVASPPSLTGLVRLAPFAHMLQPTDIASPPGDPSRVFVTQQNGLVLLFIDGQLQDEPFIDLTRDITAEGEKGLLSIVFAPDYDTSGLLYVYYADTSGFAHLREYRRSPLDPNVAVDPRDVLDLPQSSAEHFAGDMEFGPDGYLYVSIGDGGPKPGEPSGYFGQTLDDLLGSIIRIDPRHGDPYTVPRSNPFSRDPGVEPEIVAYGLRNPWRIWIDGATDTMLIADVGEDVMEEIDRLSLHDLGVNFGWPCREGTITPPEVPRPADCTTAVTTGPLYAYDHSDTRCAIIGGVVAEDPRLPALTGYYLWSDLCDGRLYALDPAATDPTPVSLGVHVDGPTDLGIDAEDRIYVADNTGAVYRLDPR